MTDIKAFAAENGLTDIIELLRKGTLATRSLHFIEFILELNEDDRLLIAVPTTVFFPMCAPPVAIRFSASVELVSSNLFPCHSVSAAEEAPLRRECAQREGVQREDAQRGRLDRGCPERGHSGRGRT
jgi:hypothetical protein